MFVRAVRFTDVPAERIEASKARIEAAGGAPPGVPARRLQALYDQEQGTALVLQFFDTAEDLRKGEEVLDAMDASETPGTRVSVDRCEMKVDVQP